jgi:hypothetical protein
VTNPVRFDDALAAAVTWVRSHSGYVGTPAYIFRDVYGRVRVLVRDPEDVPSEAREELSTSLGKFSVSPDRVLLAQDEFGDEAARHAQSSAVAPGVRVIERLVTEQNWDRAPVPHREGPPRITFFGIKGGVGRTTALVALARHLVAQEKRVLVVDLDLESPGATTMLLGEDGLPRYGVIDWLVEETVEQADAALVADMVLRSRALVGNRTGEVLVVPAMGTSSIPPLDDAVRDRHDGAFVAKLGRAYVSPHDVDIAHRLGRMLDALEATHHPDVVLLDSRAGIHDISAATVSRLGATALLFAGASAQTWLAYRLLFSAWRRDPSVLEAFRDRLQVVAAQVPETGRVAHLETLRGRAWSLFTNFVYDAPPEGDEDESASPFDQFNFDLDDDESPHAALPVYWRRELVEWDPMQPDTLTPEQFAAAYGEFLRGVTSLTPGLARADSP